MQSCTTRIHVRAVILKIKKIFKKIFFSKILIFKKFTILHLNRLQKSSRTCYLTFFIAIVVAWQINFSSACFAPLIQLYISKTVVARRFRICPDPSEKTICSKFSLRLSIFRLSIFWGMCEIITPYKVVWRKIYFFPQRLIMLSSSCT